MWSYLKSWTVLAVGFPAWLAPSVPPAVALPSSSLLSAFRPVFSLLLGTLRDGPWMRRDFWKSGPSLPNSKAKWQSIHWYFSSYHVNLLVELCVLHFERFNLHLLAMELLLCRVDLLRHRESLFIQFNLFFVQRFHLFLLRIDSLDQFYRFRIQSRQLSKEKEDWLIP